jgi:hypothetical protein
MAQVGQFRVHMIHHFLEYNVDLGAPFMINARNFAQVFCADMTGEDWRNCNGFFDARISGLGLVFTFTFAVTSSMI